MQFRSFAKKIFKSELDFTKLQKNYRIESLTLHKLNLSKILQYYRQIEVKYAFESKKGKTWFENQLRIFIWVVFHYAFFINKKPAQLTSCEWETIAEFFHKDYLTCKYFFLCIQKNRKSQWTEEEDKYIMEAINKPNFTNQWTEIGKDLYLSSEGNKFKKPKEIRQRWNNYLNPNVLKDKWSADEDLVLFRIVSKEGRKWALISKILQTRSEHSVKNRYTNLFKKFKSYQTNANRNKRSELQAEFVKCSLLKIQQEKLKISADRDLDLKADFQETEKIIGSQKEIEEQEKIIHPDDSHSEIKQKANLDNSLEASPQLEFIKSPVYYTQKQDDFMSTDNLMRSFQPSYHSFLF